MSDRDIIKAIKRYAAAYEEIQKLQEDLKSIPEGDQKTGCIGEYYAYKYLEKKYPECELIYGSHSEKGWDIKVKGKRLKVQVKTVSAYSKTRTISPIHKGWNELYIVYLNRKLYPEGFWMINDTTIFGSSEKLSSKKCRDPNNPNTGSSSLPFGENHIEKLLAAINA